MKTKSSNITMATLLAKYKTSPKSYNIGQQTTGIITSITSKAVTLDIGGKSEALVAENAYKEARDYIKTLKVGDQVTGDIIVSESVNGYVIVSFRRTLKNFLWDKLQKVYDAGENLDLEVKSVSQAGFLVDIQSLQGFVPASQMSREVAKSPSSYVGKKMLLRIIDIDRGSNKIVLSERAVSEADVVEAQKKAIKKVEIGDIFKGTVVNISDFGVFIEIKVKVGKEEIPLDGLVHVSEISWEKVGNPHDIYKVGDIVGIKVIEKKDTKLAFSIKHAKGDPWETISKKYKMEDKIKGKVAKISDFGVFVALEPGIDGLIHITKIPPDMRFKVGDEISCLIEEINPEEKRISLGLVLTSKPVGYK